MTSSHGGRASNRPEPVVPDLDDSRFEMLDVIGTGGMGTVYRAVQRSVGRHVAIKMLSPEHADNATGLGRFVREANAIARLAHPNIVQLIDFGRDREGNLLLVMELLEGEPLRSLLRREGALAPDRAAYVAMQCLNALRTAHAAGVIHRDLKPENIFIQRVAGEDHVKVLDFGVAKLTQADGSSDVTNTTDGSLLGTLRYMAPEQIAGEPPDPRIDVYAMGMVLYEMLAGVMPFETRDRLVLLRQILAEEPPSVSVKAPHTPPALAAVVMQAIAKSPRDRHPSADDLRRALLPFLSRDHSAVQEHSEASSHGGAVPGGNFRSGVVRSGRVESPPGGVVPPVLAAPVAALTARPETPLDLHPMPVADSGVMRDVMVKATATPSPAAPRRPRMLLVALCLMVALVGALGAGVYVLASRRVPSPPPPVAEPTAPTAPLGPVVPAPPAASPAPTPPPATRMVVLNTTPAGAAVDNVDGTELCPQTPCAIPIPAGGSRTVRLTRGALSLNAVIDGTSPTMTLDLGQVPVAPPGGDHHVGSRRRGPRVPRDEDPEVPLLLPHSGR